MPQAEPVALNSAGMVAAPGRNSIPSELIDIHLLKIEVLAAVT